MYKIYVCIKSTYIYTLVGVFPFCFVKVTHKLNGHEFEQTPGGSEGQGGLACCSPRGFRVGQNLATEQQQL